MYFTWKNQLVTVSVLVLVLGPTSFEAECDVARTLLAVESALDNSFGRRVQVTVVFGIIIAS